MHLTWRAGLQLAAAGSAITLITMIGSVPVSAAPAGKPGPAGLLPALRGFHHGTNDGGGESGQILDQAEQFSAVRTAPGTKVSPAAFAAATAAAAKLAHSGGRWREVTNQPYNSDALGYRDPIWSNSSGGAGLVSGRMTALAVDGRALYAGAAAGGVWRSMDGGAHWKPVFTQQNNLSIGAIAVNPADGSVWVGTGEANTSQDSYAGNGIYRSADNGRTWHLYAATSYGLIRRSALDLTSSWKTVLKPDPNPTNSPYRTSFVTDVKVQPGTNGNTVIAAVGWRGGTLPTDVLYNGFYLSVNGGKTFSKVTPTGALKGASDLGRTTFAYSADGTRLYAVIESTATVALKGVYESPSGNLAGPWTLIANAQTFINSGSALGMSGGTPGQQAWYNQAIIVDPNNDNHVFVDLEEVFETNNAGQTWTTTGPYWNFPFPCWNVDPAKDTCPGTVHADQHALAISGGTLYTADDGGVYSHPLRDVGVVKWRDLNATLHTLQYYYSAIGKAPSGRGDYIWGGMQDNGVGLLTPGAKQMVSPFGGDGTDNIVDPNNGNRAVNSYVYMSMASTTNGGRSNGHVEVYNTISPSCLNPIYQSNPCDPNPRFVAPFSADIHNINHWVAGGEFVWDNQGKGWNTNCSATACDWKQVYDTGAGNSINTIADSGPVTFAGWCGNGCNPGGSAPFTSGLATNFGGTWHKVTSAVLPNRVPTSFTIDPANPAHVVVTFGGFSRHWIPNAGVGHVFVTLNGGKTWTNVSGNLPDAPATSSVIWRGQLVVSTDVGIFSTPFAGPGNWDRVGSGQPVAPSVDLNVSPDRGYLLVATHGQGLWRIG